MSLFKKINNADAAVQILLKELGIAIGDDQISAELEKHPENGNMLAISDVLKNFGVTNDAFQVPAEEIDKVPFPFIAHAPLKRDDFLVVHQFAAGQMTVSNNQWNRHKLNFTEFKKMYGGVVLTVGKVEKPVQVKKALQKNLSKLRMPLMASGFAAVLIASIVCFTPWLSHINWPLDLLLIVKTVGLIISMLLLVQSIDRDNPLVQKICQGSGDKDCGAILSSPAAKVFDGLSWSDVGFFYFAGTWLAFLFCSNNPAAWFALAILNLISLPYTFYSIYYQARVAKQWCILCCTIQGLLWLELALFLLSDRPWLTGMTMNGLLPVGICLMLPVLIWLSLKPLLLHLTQVALLKRQLNKFKYDSKLFNNILKSQPQYVQPAEEWSIVLGNKTAETIITMVSNPFCPPCSGVHEQLDDWLDQNPNLQARIVLKPRHDEDDMNTPVSRHLTALNALPDQSLVKRAMHDWYEQKQTKYEEWAKVYPAQLNGAEYDKINAQKAWCDMAEITDTPTILINGYFLPKMYQLRDLKYMLE